MISDYRECRHFFAPFCKIIDGNNDIPMPPSEQGLLVIKSMPHLAKGPMVMTGSKREGGACIFH